MSARMDALGRRSRWPSVEERFAARHTPTPGPLETPCWQWDVLHPTTGYGTIFDSTASKNLLAHRWSYEHHVGPIPAGLEIDHLCRNRGCVNPAHLEPVTSGENTRRGFWGMRTHCNHGHEFTPENTVRTRKGTRLCVACKRTRDRKHREAS